MGMDVYGKAPKSETGEYFRNNVWWWRPLWNYCEEVGAEIIPEDNLGHSNDGWGLIADDASRLADLLDAEIASGRCAAYAEAYEKQRAAQPKETCSLCKGTGKVPAPVEEGPYEKDCWRCEGTGQTESLAASYPFSVENVQEFVKFLRDCGGFEIC